MTESKSIPATPYMVAEFYRDLEKRGIPPEGLLQETDSLKVLEIKEIIRIIICLAIQKAQASRSSVMLYGDSSKVSSNIEDKAFKQYVEGLISDIDKKISLGASRDAAMISFGNMDGSSEDTDDPFALLKLVRILSDVLKCDKKYP